MFSVPCYRFSLCNLIISSYLMYYVSYAIYSNLVFPHQPVISKIWESWSVIWIRFTWQDLRCCLFAILCITVSIWPILFFAWFSTLAQGLYPIHISVRVRADAVLTFRLGSYCRSCPWGVTFPTVFTRGIKAFFGRLKTRLKSSTDQEARKGNFLIQEAGSLQW